MEGTEVEGTEVGAEALVCLEDLGLQDHRWEETLHEIMSLMAETMEILVYLVDSRNKIM
jgi:hypothetical protein